MGIDAVVRKAWRALWAMLREFPRQALRVTFIRFCLCLVRYVWFVHVRHALRTLESQTGVATHTIAHNLKGMKDLAVERSLRLIFPLVALERVRVNARDLKVLTIGPRTEGEIFNLVAYGFSRRNITGLDIISYSPYVTLGDMHKMPFPDGSFDIVIVGWVLAYSDRKTDAAAEILRVCKSGGLVAAGVEWSSRTVAEVAAERGYVPGSSERIPDMTALESLFGEGVGKVYFRQDESRMGRTESGDLLLVFETRV